MTKVPGGFEIRRNNSTGTRNLCIDDGGADLCQVDEVRFRFQQGSPPRSIVINQVSIGTTDNHYQWGELAVYARDFAPDSTLWVVLEGLTMDQYIYGLAEVPASWPDATLQTQAVAGRTYAYDRIVSRRASSSWDFPWDLYSTVDDQVYHGYDKETGSFGANWTANVDATSDQVMLYNGDPITAFYSSSNGGWSEDSGYVFVTSLPLPHRPGRRLRLLPEPQRVLDPRLHRHRDRPLVRPDPVGGQRRECGGRCQRGRQHRRVGPQGPRHGHRGRHRPHHRGLGQHVPQRDQPGCGVRGGRAQPPGALDPVRRGGPGRRRNRSARWIG